MKYQQDEHKQFGKLTRIGPWFRCGSPYLYRAVFLCQCGKITVTTRFAVRQGTTTCGCLQKEAVSKAATKHGHSRTPEYYAWFHMVRRCHNPKDESYEHYGARGIRVCRRWRNSVVNFVTDMGKRPSPKHMLDRRDNSKGYSPENCRWVLNEVQQNNRRNNHSLTINGATKNVSQWAREKGCTVSVITIFGRLRKKWPAWAAVFAPFRTTTANAMKMKKQP